MAENKMLDVASFLMSRFLVLLGVVTQLNINGLSDEKSYKDEIAGALSDLKAIGVSLRICSHESGQKIGMLLACTADDKQGVSIASAEKALLRVFNQFRLEQSLLISRVYQAKVTPDNPSGKTIAEKWGSSYNTWCMPSEKWELAAEFVSLTDETESLPFPLAWDKKPEMYGGVVNCLMLSDGSCHSIPTDKFGIYIEEARKWVHADEISLGELLADLKSSSFRKRAGVLRLIGARRDPKQIPIIVRAMVEERMEVRHAAVWALGWIGDPAAIPALANTIKSDEGTRTEALIALKRIGNDAAISLLSQFLMDQSALVRRTAAEALGEIQSKEAIEALLKALADPDKETRESVRAALRKLGYKPD